MTIALGTLILLLLGAGFWRLATPGRYASADWVAAVGYTILLGLLAVGWTTRLPSMVGIDALPSWRWLWPLLPAILVWSVVFATGRHPAPWRSMAPDWPLSRLLLAAVLALIVLRLIWLVDEAWLRPLFGWDAWLAWSAKAKAWALTGEAVAFVPVDTWLNEEPGSVRISLAYSYPEMLAWIEVWLAGIAGGWHEATINLAWPVLWIALLAGSFGQWRVLGADRHASMIGLYLLASLPLLNVHAALPGYADLWIGTTLAFAVLCWLRWMQFGERRQLALALVLLATLPALKFEGAVWALCMVGLMLWFVFERRSIAARTVILVAGAMLAVLISWALDLQWWRMVVKLLAPAPDGSGTTIMGAFIATLSGMFAQGNWHLLWYSLPLVLAWRRRALCSWPALAGVSFFVLGGLLLIMALFLFTQAGRWAESYTAVNRLLMHLVPTAVLLMVLCFRREPADSRLAQSEHAVDQAAVVRVDR